MELRGQYSSLFCGYAKIYTLSDYDGIVFYVGCTSRSLEQRLTGHILQAKKALHFDKKCLKIRKCGFKIFINEIDSVYITGSRPKFALPDAYKKEKEWIARYFLEGHPLTNRFPVSRLYKKGQTAFLPKKYGYAIVEY